MGFPKALGCGEEDFASGSFLEDLSGPRDSELFVDVTLAAVVGEDSYRAFLGRDEQRERFACELDVDVHTALGSVVVGEVRVEELDVLLLSSDEIGDRNCK